MRAEKYRFHRVFRKLKEMINAGENMFFIYGDSTYTNDIFYTEIEGKGKLLHLRESIVEAFKEYENIDSVIEIYNKDGRIHLTSSKPLKKSVSIRDDLMEFSKSDEEILEESYDNIDALINEIKMLNMSELKTGGWLIVFDDFNQIAKTYRGFDSHDIGRIFSEVILNWRKLQGNYYIFILRDKDLGRLEEFGISQEKTPEKLVEVSEPSVHELAKALVLVANQQGKILYTPLDYATKYLEKPKPLKMVVREAEEKFKEIEGEEIKGHMEENLTLDDVKLKENIRKKIREIFEKFKEGKSVTNGIILYGPPGTGKTTIAKALANEVGAFFLKTSASDFKGEFLGQSGQNTRRIFEKLKNNKPAVLFIDEADAILAKREGYIGDTYTTEIVNEFLANVDGLKSDKEIFVIIATNYVNRLDEAIRSRFEEIEIGLPEGEALKELVSEHLGKDFENDYEMFYGLSGRDISQIGKQLKEGVISTKEEVIEKIKLQRLSGLNPRTPRWDFSQVCGYARQKEAVRRYFEKDIKRLVIVGDVKVGKTFFIEALAGEFGLTIIESLPNKNPKQLHGMEDKVLFYAKNKFPLELVEEFTNIPAAIEISLSKDAHTHEVLNTLLRYGFVDIKLELDRETLKEYAKKKLNIELSEDEIRNLIGKSFPYIENFIKIRMES